MPLCMAQSRSLPLANMLLRPQEQATNITIPSIQAATDVSVQKHQKKSLEQKFAPRILSAQTQMGIWCTLLNFLPVQKDTPVLTDHEIDRLHLIGETISGTNHCVRKIFQTRTVFGEAQVAAQLTQPTANISVIQDRQEALKQIQIYRNDITRILDTIAQHQGTYFGLFQDFDNALKKGFQQLYFNRFKNSLNASPLALTASRMGQVINKKPLFAPIRAVKNIPTVTAIRFGVLALATGCVMLDSSVRQEMLQAYNAQYQKNETKPSVKMFPYFLYHTIQALEKTTVEGMQAFIDKHRPAYSNYAKKYFDTVPLGASVIIGLALASLGQLYSTPKIYASTDRFVQSASLEYMRKQVASMAQLWHHLKELHARISASDVLKKALPHADAITKLMHSTGDLKKLITLLESGTFTGNGSCVLDSGRILAAYNLLHKQKTHFIEACAFVGEVDALYAAAHLVQEKNYCLATVVAGDTPYVHAQELYHPLLNDAHAVRNTIMLNEKKHMIITGPNGSGKTVFMTALADALIMAQSFGIAPAQTFTFTPFDQIHTYLNEQEDLKNGISTFMAEQKQLAHIKESLTTAPPTHKTFILMDEPAKGTVERSGGPLVYQAAQDLDAPNSMIILATHFKKPTELSEQSTRNFENYHVQLQEPTPGIFVRTFKLIKGPNMKWFTDDDWRQRFIDWLFKYGQQPSTINT